MSLKHNNLGSYTVCTVLGFYFERYNNKNDPSVRCEGNQSMIQTTEHRIIVSLPSLVLAKLVSLC